MLKSVYLVAGAAVIAAIILLQQGGDGNGLTEAQVRNLACGEILGEWEMFLEADENTPTGQLSMATGGIARFSLDDEGRVFTRDLDINREGRASDKDNPVIDVGRAYCEESGSTFTLVRAGKSRAEFELVSPDELHPVDDRTGMTLIYRRVKSLWSF